MNALKGDRAARHARQGVHAAARAFCEIHLSAASASEARRALDDALARVEGGPAPRAFKDAAREELLRRFASAYPAENDGPPTRAA